jgi:hypothetical protein
LNFVNELGHAVYERAEPAIRRTERAAAERADAVNA